METVKQGEERESSFNSEPDNPEGVDSVKDHPVPNQLLGRAVSLELCDLGASRKQGRQGPW